MFSTIGSKFCCRNRQKQPLQTLFDRYNLNYPLPPHDPCATLHSNNNQQKAAADAYRALPEANDLTDENSYYAPHSIATSSFAPRYALATPSPHSIPTTSNETPQPTRTEHFPQRRFPSFFIRLSKGGNCRLFELSPHTTVIHDGSCPPFPLPSPSLPLPNQIITIKHKGKLKQQQH